ncbi:MAG: TetR/AcrR family transcriptional regulator [Myxococcales bacterium]|nr:TetR/AcrR family transcriptional regulator [Myxococcales bacterium]
MARKYESPVREEQASRTRVALLDACEALLLELPVEDVTLPLVAQRAGVTKPTAYRHFPDTDALVAAFLEHLRGRIGMELSALVAVQPDELAHAVRHNYRKFDENARLPPASWIRRATTAPVARARSIAPRWRRRRGAATRATPRSGSASARSTCSSPPPRGAGCARRGASRGPEPPAPPPGRWRHSCKPPRRRSTDENPPFHPPRA